MDHSPTPEQQEIMDAAREGKHNMMIQALAGTGKTSTLELIASVTPVMPTLALAFNVKNKKDLEKKFPGHYEVKTINGLGHGAFGRAIGKRLIVEEKKLGTLITQLFKELDYRGEENDWIVIKQLVSGAMQQGLVPVPYDRNFRGVVSDTEANWQSLDTDMITVPEHLIAMARRVLCNSIEASFNGIISYDDQIYMSTMFGGVFPRFPRVKVDEAQDLSPLNHIMVQRCAAELLTVVGDSHQAIYAFRGADSSSMNKLRRLRQQWKDLKLSVTFRCPKVIVARQQDHVPGYTAHVTNETGNLVRLAEKEQESWNWQSVIDVAVSGTIAILCRNNAPLLSMAFKLLRKHIGCVMLGRDIGRGLDALSKKIVPQDDTPTADFIKMVCAWRDNEIYKMQLEDNTSKIDKITDQTECLLAVAESSGASTAGDLRKAIKELFARESGRITLSTGHRAKGLEWQNVIHLDPWRVPSKWAQKALANGNPIPMQQELNLRYVIETRVINTLILANLAQFED